MQAGKLPPEQLTRLVLNRFARRRNDVLVHAGLGEDCAVIDFGDEVCVISTDPITGAGKGAGRLAVHVSCNDVAANGAQPVGVQVALLLPEGTSEANIAHLMDEIEQGCTELGIEVLGGHTEITSKVSAPVIVTTALGKAAKQCYVTSAGACLGNEVVVTKGVGLEGTAILATDWGHCIVQAGSSCVGGTKSDVAMQELLARAKGFAQELSAVREGVAAAAFGVTAMHDITEGGLYGALWEMSQAAGLEFLIEETQVPVRPETAFICGCLALDPFGLISSGAMLITCADGKGLTAHLATVGVPAYVIGTVVNIGRGGIRQANGHVRTVALPPEDELWRFLKTQN